MTTKSQEVQNAASVIALLLIAGSLWRPEWKWLDEMALMALIIGISTSFAAQTDTDRERARRGSWMLPVAALAAAAPWVYYAPADDRVRTALLGVALVMAASAIAWLRKRAR